MGKRYRCSEPSTTTTTNQRRSREEEPPIEEDTGFEIIDRALADPVGTLAEEIKRFDTDPKVLADLSKIVDSDKQVQALWFKELRKEWEQGPPTTPMDAARLVLDVLNRVHDYYVLIGDLEGFLFHYSLPHYREVLPQPQTEWIFSRITFPPYEHNEEPALST
ncbi:hypothetical protein SSX86_011757 [Deinandra increscens subsp. villosa]|uniref:Uncharacterized protein n=1 Tax=Deinandra increscens subsp. villosa TaxID=3103831 RepID=A0AAP0D2V4_9ASTR